MKILFKWTWPAVVVMLLSAIYVLAPHSETNYFSTPLYAQETQGSEGSPSDSMKSATMPAGETVATPWLHVTVETNYGWFYQESIAKAWTTKTRDSEERVAVGLLCIKLTAHHEVENCLPDTSYIEIKDVKRRVSTRKKTATATAWAKDPDIPETSVSLEP